MKTSLAHVLLFNATKAAEQTGPIPMRSVMFTAVRSDSKQKAIRDKARLNAWIARDLAEGFGGKKADYLKMLNGKLKEEFHLCRKTAQSCLAQAARFANRKGGIDMNTGKVIALAASAVFCLGVFTGCIVLIPNGCGKETVSGSGEVVTRTREMPEFERVLLKGSGRVTLVRGEVQRVEIKTDENILPLIQTEVRGDVLEISQENFNLRPTALEIRLSLRRLRGVTIAGSGGVIGQSAFEADEFQAEINGSGHLELAVVASRLATKINGSGSMVLTGKAAEHQATIKGSGDIRAFGLESQKATILIAGSGDCSLCAYESLTASISGSGDVIYTGSPRVESRVKGSGSVKARR